jgi:hypothetical protein
MINGILAETTIHAVNTFPRADRRPRLIRFLHPRDSHGRESPPETAGRDRLARCMEGVERSFRAPENPPGWQGCAAAPLDDTRPRTGNDNIILHRPESNRLRPDCSPGSTADSTKPAKTWPRCFPFSIHGRPTGHCCGPNARGGEHVNCQSTLYLFLHLKKQCTDFSLTAFARLLSDQDPELWPSFVVVDVHSARLWLACVSNLAVLVLTARPPPHPRLSTRADFVLSPRLSALGKAAPNDMCE